MNSTMMIHQVKEAVLTEKRILDYGTGKCYMNELRVKTVDGSEIMITMCYEKIAPGEME